MLTYIYIYDKQGTTVIVHTYDKLRDNIYYLTLWRYTCHHNINLLDTILGLNLVKPLLVQFNVNRHRNVYYSSFVRL